MTTSDNQLAQSFRAKIARGKWFERRSLVQLGAVALVVFLLIPHFVGLERVIAALAHANLVFIALALISEVMRYIASAASTRALARMVDRDVPMSPLVQAFFAGAAANRTFSTGGAPGMLVRLLCLKRYNVSTGGVFAIFLIENINGILISIPMLLVGLAILGSTQAIPGIEIHVDRALPLSAIALTLIGVYVLTRRDWIEKISFLIARSVNRITNKFLRREFFVRERVRQWLDDFYLGLSAARRAPVPVAISLLMNGIRYATGMFSMYFTFLAVGFTVSPDVLILMYTSMSFITTLSATPGEVAIMGSGIALLSMTTGVPKEIAVTAMLLSRGLAFWMPIPVGLGALWNMVRQEHL